MNKYESAINYFKIKLDVAKLFEEDDKENAKMQMCFYKIAIEALDKQIPKKPFEPAFDVQVLNNNKRCPECGSYIIKAEQHCPCCGQALDWSEEE